MSEPTSGMARERISSQLLAARTVTDAILADQGLIERIEAVAAACIDCLRSGGKILLAGNGGSAADCQHIACELVGRFMIERASLPAVALTTDTSALTAIGNDYGFEELFSRQLESLGNSNDLLIAYSTSGKSANVIAALKTAHSKGMITVGMTGNRHGPMQDHCDHVVNIPSASTPRIQEGHLNVGHIICGLIEDGLFGTS